MRFQDFINEEDIVKKALSIEEPKKTKKYSKKEVDDWLDTLNKAADKLDSEIDSMKDGEIKKAKQAELRDIADKINKWEERLQAAQEPEEPPTDTTTEPTSGEAPPEEEQP